MAAFDDTRDNITRIEDTIIAGDMHCDDVDDDDAPREYNDGANGYDCADEECESVWGVYY